MRRVALLASVMSAAIALMAGCDDGQLDATTPTEAGGEAGGAVTPAATSRGPAPDCRLEQLDVGLTGSDSGSTHRSEVIVFRNTGSSTCSLFGYPGVAGLDATGAQQDQAERTLSGYLGGIRDGKATRVTLAPDATASATVEASAADSGPDCPAYPRVLVTPPNETHSVRLDWPNEGCSGLEVHPVVAGSTGSR